MRAIQLIKIRRLELRDLPKPSIRRPTDVLLKLTAVGVCGSDIHYYKTGRIGSQIVRYPFTLGHECAARVIKIGKKVTRVKPGDLVAVEPAMACGRCDQCRLGRPHTCRNLRFLGCPGQAEGCLSEYLVMPQQCCYPVATRLTPELAALSEPLAIGLYAIKLSEPLRHKSIAILGCGPIGLSVMLCAKLQHPRAIYATDKINQRLLAARRAGATWAGNPARSDVVKAIAARNPLGLDVVYECCGEQEALDQAVNLLRPGGKLILVGIPSVKRITFISAQIRRKEICIQNVRRQHGCLQATLDLIARRRLRPEFMLTHSFPLARASAAFELVAGYRAGVIKAMITF